MYGQPERSMVYYRYIGILAIYQDIQIPIWVGERGGSVVECRTREREVRGSRPTAAVLCPWARHFTPRKYWLITQEAMAPSRYDWKIVDWDVKPQHNQKSYMSHYQKVTFSVWQIETKWLQSKKINNDQELIQSDPTSCPQNHKGNN